MVCPKLYSKYNKSKNFREISYNKRSSYLKIVTTENNWTFELGVGIGIDVPKYIMVGLMQRGQFDQQHQNINTFCRRSVVNAQ